MSRTVAPPRVVNIADLRRLAKRRLPRLAFDYIDGGADDEITLRENSLASRRLTFRPRSAVATSAADLRTTVLGTTLDLPFCSRPSAAAGCSIRAARSRPAKAAGAAGTAYILSTLSGCRLEDVRAATRGPAWYQVYLVGGRDIATAGIARAQAAGFSALVLTIDTAGRRTARARRPQRRQGTGQRNALGKAAVRTRKCWRGRDGWLVSWRTAG
jgi:L-lactate dehydrogenase (cytochrome)